ncbi:F-box protein At1g67340-like [Lolium rigidum]|uniref:F-box protein At1g67340-like n=1 Tax=Lolium rigidum TaxID=89674 RepID=UPI001F5CD9F3|nr:F-box protein At1g67340-like [Lolium rigidum]
MKPNKRSRISHDNISPTVESNFDHLPDELVVSILASLSSSANTPADLAGAMMTDRRFRQLAHSKLVLKKASMGCLAVRAKNWSEAADRFLQRCADAGNLEASYILGMIRFYCARSRRTGAALIVSAANGGHLEAIFSLAVIQFNGSGVSKQDRDLTLGAGLCARAARLGHVDATRELGHCLLDGYGVTSAPINGRLLLQRAKQRDAENERQQASLGTLHQKTHHANTFLSEWFSQTPEARNAAHCSDKSPIEEIGDMRLCSNALCGRQETRLHEFRRCSACASAYYCSRACQAADWKMGHRTSCMPRNQEINPHGNQNHVQEGQPE